MASPLCATANLIIPENESSRVGHHINQLKRLDKMQKQSSPVIAEQQLRLDLQVAAELEIDGVGMGVLTDGTPFLTLRGLSRMSGADIAAIVRITADWQLSPLRPREQKIRELVRAQGADDSVAFYAVMRNGVVNHIVPPAVCMAILEYYAFEARGDNEQAAKSFRLLARKGFTDFIYAQVGYNPSGAPNIAWQQFHDRVTLAYHTVPVGYFSIFKELADIFVMLIRKGANLGPSFVPDISVGILWAKHWANENLEVLYGPRIKYEHNYPLYFPQAASNPQQPYCYPDDALGEFRKWVREVYLPKRMPGYLSDKVRQGQLTATVATAALEAFEPPKSIKGR
ncbi:hypothetical protein [Bradyrhizobium oligotrophicum]|uniref:hypothetical protein n=1 Tax=Bradyrhizobium oligotrophicum TaxID=44255 RepID=UPI003EBFF52B